MRDEHALHFSPGGDGTRQWYEQQYCALKVRAPARESIRPVLRLRYCRRRGETVFLAPPSKILAPQAIPPRFLASCKWNTSTAATRRKVACQEGEMRTNEAPLRPPPRPLRAKKSNTKNGGPQRIYGIVELKPAQKNEKAKRQFRCVTEL